MRSRVLALALALTSAAAAAQTPPRRAATNIAALLAFPTFFHGRQVVVVGQVSTDDGGRIRVSDGVSSVRVVFKSAPDGNDEIRGVFWDVGRMNHEDPRLAGYDLRATFGIDPDGAWPKPGEVTAIIATGVTSSAVPAAPSVRAIVLNPSRYVGQRVTVNGQFAGRNLMGDLPDAPARSRWDFVVRSADASVWVSGARPKGKGFDLALDARIDTGRWLEITGVVHEGRGLQWIEVTSEGIALGKSITEPAPVEEATTVRLPPPPPPEVVFSAPTQEESDVPLNTSIRIQFSRDLNASTLKNRVRVRYLESESTEKGEPTTPTADFTTQYVGATRVLELKFAKPLERFRTLKVDLLEGILGTDAQPLAPWTLTFVLGAS